MNAIEYKLRFLLNSTTLKVLKVRQLMDSTKMAEFNNAFYDTKKVQAFCTEVGEMTRFPVLNVPLSKEGTIHHVFFCEVAVGESLFVSSHYAETIDPPTGIGSLLSDGSDKVGFLQDSGVEIQDCFYVVKDKSRILPLYEVKFEYDPEFERFSRGKCVCHRCKANDAVVFCPSEAANFCAACDKQVHFDPFLEKHERLYFAEVGQKKFICCPQHSTKTIEYFCDECAEPLCAECQISGRHSTPEFSRHKLRPFIDACRAAASAVKAESGSFGGVSDAVARDIEALCGGVASFRQNIAGLRRGIENEFKHLMQRLDSIESFQRQTLNAKYMEKLLVKKQTERMVSYPNELDPADLLLLRKHIFEQRKIAEEFKSEPTKIKNFSYEGKITINEPVEAGSVLPTTQAMDKAVAWRVETMNMDLKHSI